MEIPAVKLNDLSFVRCDTKVMVGTFRATMDSNLDVTMHSEVDVGIMSASVEEVWFRT